MKRSRTRWAIFGLNVEEVAGVGTLEQVVLGLTVEQHDLVTAAQGLALAL